MLVLPVPCLSENDVPKADESIAEWLEATGGLYMPVGRLMMKRTLPFMFYLVYFAAAAFLQPFFILYFQELGFNGMQIGLLAGLTPLVILVGAPLWTGLADAKMRHRLIMSLTIIVCVVAAALFPLTRSFTLMIPLIFLYALFAAPIIPFADSATLSMLGEKKDLYGRVRLGGTIGWGLLGPVAGLVIETHGLKWAFWGFAAIMIFTLFIIQGFTFSRPGAPVSWVNDVHKLLKDRRWLPFVALAFIAGVAFSVMNGYLLPYMEELGISRSIMGVAIFIAAISELPVLFFANFLLRRFKARGLLVLGMLITGVRLILYAALNFQAGILVFQLLNGLTFPAVWVAAISYANEIAPEGLKATAQGLLAAMTFGIGSAAGGLVGGLLLGSIHGQATFLIIGIIVLLGLGVVSFSDRMRQLHQTLSST